MRPADSAYGRGAAEQSAAGGPGACGCYSRRRGASRWILQAWARASFTASAHKLHGPKGVGVVVKKGAPFESLLPATQERKRRGGTKRAGHRGFWGCRPPCRDGLRRGFPYCSPARRPRGGSGRHLRRGFACSVPVRRACRIPLAWPSGCWMRGRGAAVLFGAPKIRGRVLGVAWAPSLPRYCWPWARRWRPRARQCASSAGDHTGRDRLRHRNPAGRLTPLRFFEAFTA